MITDKDAQDAMSIVNMMLETGHGPDVRAAYLTILTGVSPTISPEEIKERIAELYRIRSRQIDRTKSVAESLIQKGADTEAVSSLIDTSGNLGVIQSIITILENQFETNDTHA